jgi:ABC-type phosphate/phosphonate transport system permease subunit
VRRQHDAALRVAKSELGVWSEAGLEESRALLWRSFESGKVFAQRQTFWDSLFNLMGSRDKDWLYLLLQLLSTALINYTIGTVMSVFAFALSLPTFLASFAPSWPSAIAFFALAVVASASVVASYLLLLYVAGGAVVYTAASFATVQQRQRLAGGGYPVQPRRVRYRGQQHFD